MSEENVSHAKAAIRHLRKDLGIPIPKKPKWLKGKAPELPQQLESLGDRELTQLMSKFTSYIGYVGARLAIASIRYRQADEKLSRYSTIELVRMRGEMTRKDSVTEKKAIIATSERAIELSERAALRQAEKDLLEAVWNAADGAYKALSRELTRRTNTFERRDE